MAEIAEEYEKIKRKVSTGMLPLVARIPAIEKVVDVRTLGQADYFDSSGKRARIKYGDDSLLDRFADLILYEELRWSHPDKMSIVEYPVMSDNQEQSYFDKHTPNSDLQYGDRRFTGRRKTHFTDDLGAPHVRNSRIAGRYDPEIEKIGDYVDLYDALDNAGLTERQREAIDLVYFENMTYEEAGAHMGVTKQAISRYVSFALGKLRKVLV